MSRLVFCRAPPCAATISRRCSAAIGTGIFFFSQISARIGQRAPGDELLDVLEHDHPRAHGGGVADGDPGQAANLLFHWLAALGLGEVLAVRAKPAEVDRAASGDGARVYLPHALAVVFGVRVVDLVHGDGFGVVVDGDINRPAEGQLDASGGAATAGEVVDHQAAEVEAGLWVDAVGVVHARPLFTAQWNDGRINSELMARSHSA